MRWMAAAAVAGALAVTAAHADEALTLEQLRHARSLSHQIMSPYCPGRTLADCPSAEAEPVKSRIREWVGQGLSDDEIHARLGAVFGDRIEGGPRSFAKALLPWLLVALGAVGLLLALRRLRSPAAVRRDPIPGAAAGSALLEELERDLRD